ncbi:hypothetical protein HUU05_03010 [candidate division KSB1 bacterium]|nr:hypothetical protein [candidate division KSB1 bacterium]
MKTRQVLIPACVCVLLISCAPLPIYRLHPIAEDTRWLQGQERVYVAQHGVEAEIAFDRTDGSELVFDLWIHNRSAPAFCIAPEQFYYVLLHTPKDTSSAQIGRVYARNPETKLLQIDVAVSRENASQATSAALDFTSATLNLVGDLATIKEEKTPEQIEQKEQEQREEEAARQERELLQESKLSRLQRERAYWATAPLRKTTLEMNQSLEGLVYFPAVEKKFYMYLKLMLPLGETTLEFVFAQEKIKP